MHFDQSRSHVRMVEERKNFFGFLIRQTTHEIEQLAAVKFTLDNLKIGESVSLLNYQPSFGILCLEDNTVRNTVRNDERIRFNFYDRKFGVRVIHLQF